MGLYDTGRDNIDSMITWEWGGRLHLETININSSDRGRKFGLLRFFIWDFVCVCVFVLLVKYGTVHTK